MTRVPVRFTSTVSTELNCAMSRRKCNWWSTRGLAFSLSTRGLAFSFSLSTRGLAFSLSTRGSTRTSITIL
eukprot:scaffold192319_cov94-Attheya_sp.AAC.1